MECRSTDTMRGAPDCGCSTAHLRDNTESLVAGKRPVLEALDASPNSLP